MKAIRYDLSFIGAAVGCIVAGSAQAVQVPNSGFETMGSTTGTLPTDYGYWQGDMTDIILSENGIVPCEGVCMLRFDHTTRFGAEYTTGSELWQIIDVSAHMPLIRSGNAQVQADAWFNRVANPFDSAIDTMFDLSVFAYAGSVASFPNQWNNSELASGISILYSDSDVETWERAAVTFDVPDMTDFIVLRVCATENVFNDLTGDEFAGHYVDCLGFNIVPSPASLLYLAPVGMLALGRRRRSA